MYTERVSIGDLVDDPHNTRSHSPRNIAAIKKSLASFSQVEPLVVQRSTNKVIGGNGRLQAMKELGWESVSVHYVDIDDRKAAALGIALNRTGELATWDFEKLGEILSDLSADDSLFDSTGWDDIGLGELAKELKMDLGPEVSEVDTPEPPKNPITRLGDVWTLGDHTMVCGDIAEQPPEAFEPVRLLVTDPPYGVSYAGPWGREPIENDHAPPKEMQALWGKWFGAVRPAMVPGASFYVTAPQGRDFSFLSLALDGAGFPLRHTLIWVKSSFVLGRCDYHYKHEPILYGWVEGAAHKAVENRSEVSVWEIDKPQKSELHPTMKPVELFARAIKNSSEEGWRVLDPFLGSGTTLIACEQLGRRCFGVEISPAYCDVTIERWESLTGGTATRSTLS